MTSKPGSPVVADEIADDLLLVRMEHLEDLLDVLLLPLPGVADYAAVCRWADATANPQHPAEFLSVRH